MARKVKKAVKKIFTENLKTTIIGLITAGALGYVGYTTGNPALLITAAGIATGGALSKDSE